MMAGGAVGVNVSLESASNRMRKVMRKNLNIEKFRENLIFLQKLVVIIKLLIYLFQHYE